MTTRNREVVVPLLGIVVDYQAPCDPVQDGLDAAVVTARNVVGQSPLVSELERLAELHRKREEFRRCRVQQIYSHISDEELTRFEAGPNILAMAAFLRIVMHRIVKGGV